MTVKMQQRRGTAAQWTSANPVLAAGEIGVETDTLRAKIGDGSTAWASLTYFTLENGSVGTTKLADSAVTSGKIADGAVGASELADSAVGTAAIQDGAVTPAKMARQVGNLLTDNQASGGDVLGNTTGFGTWNAEPSYSGGRIVGTKNVGPGTGWGVAINPKAAVTPGETYTIYAQSERLTGAGISTTLWWSDASNNSLGEVSVISWTTATGVQTGQIVATAPANAAWAEVMTYGADADANGSTVAVHKVGLWRGTGGQWALPGTPILGLTDAPLGNLLTANQATGGSALGTTAGFTTTGACTLSVDAGTLKVTAGASGGATVEYGVTTYNTAANQIPVTPGDTITVLYSIKSADSLAVRGSAYFYTSGGAYISEADVPANPGIVAPTSLTVRSYPVVVPATAAFVSVRLYCAAATTGQSFALDSLSVHRGAGGQWSLPGVPVPGTSRIAVNNAVDMSGTGSPEGVVTAEPGSTWLQTDATTDVKGWIKWIKATGTGNTGWVAGPEADTGWRDVTASVTGTASGSLHIRRTANVVTLRFISLELNSGSGPVPLYTFATGFKVTTSAIGALRLQTDQTKLQHIWVDPTDVSWQAEYGSVAWTTTHPTGAGSGMTGVITHTTTDAWPTSLPGSAA